MTQPPTTESLLGDEDHNTYEQAHGIATIGGKVEEEGEVDDGADNRLRHIVGKKYLINYPKELLEKTL